jgi:hypothetical protein
VSLYNPTKLCIVRNVDLTVTGNVEEFEDTKGAIRIRIIEASSFIL